MYQDRTTVASEVTKPAQVEMVALAAVPKRFNGRGMCEVGAVGLLEQECELI